MMYPFIQLEDDTEIVHSQLLEEGKVKVYIEKLQKIIESTSHLIMRFAKEGEFDTASNFNKYNGY